MNSERGATPADDYGTPPGSASRPVARPDDVSSTTRIVHAVYACISGPAGQPRDWDRMRSFCVEDARLIRAGKLQDGSTGCKIMKIDDYIRQMDGWLVENGFFEAEIHRVEERFGQIAHVFSTYESRRDQKDPKPFMRGINSFQLLFDGARWWIVSILWQHESPDHQIPPEYAPR